MSRSTRPRDVPTYVTDAREHVSSLRRAVANVTAEDLYLDVGGRTQTPDRTPKRVASPALWEPARKTLHGRWQAAWRHIGDAHRILFKEVGVVPTRWVHPVSDDGERPPAHLRPTVDTAQATYALDRLEQSLRYVDRADFDDATAQAVRRACDEVASARAEFRDEARGSHVPDTPACSNPSCDADAEPRDRSGWRPECGACRKHRERTGRMREVAA